MRLKQLYPRQLLTRIHHRLDFSIVAPCAMQTRITEHVRVTTVAREKDMVDLMDALEVVFGSRLYGEHDLLLRLLTTAPHVDGFFAQVRGEGYTVDSSSGDLYSQEGLADVVNSVANHIPLVVCIQPTSPPRLLMRPDVFVAFIYRIGQKYGHVISGHFNRTAFEVVANYFHPTWTQFAPEALYSVAIKGVIGVYAKAAEASVPKRSRSYSPTDWLSVETLPLV